MITLLMLLGYGLGYLATFRCLGYYLSHDTVEERCSDRSERDYICKGCVCKTCDGAPGYHPGHRYGDLRSDSGAWRGCSNYSPTGEHTRRLGYAWAMVISLVWPIIVPGFFIHKFKVEHGIEVKFFKPPPAIETKDQKIKRLKAQIESDRKELEAKIESDRKENDKRLRALETKVNTLQLAMERLVSACQLILAAVEKIKDKVDDV